MIFEIAFSNPVLGGGTQILCG